MSPQDGDPPRALDNLREGSSTDSSTSRPQSMYADRTTKSAMQAFTDQSEESDALRGLGAYLNMSSRISCCSATAATTLISLPYTPTFRRVHSRSSSYSHHTSVSIVPSIINSPYTPPTSNRRLLPIGTDSESMSRPSRPPEPNPALKGLGLHPDALTQKPSLQAG